MRRTVISAIGTALFLAPVLMSGAVTASAQTADAYKTPRTSYGAPDLQGYWQNTTLTPTSRRAEYGERLVLTEEETAELENNVQIEIAEANAPTDPDAGAEYRQEASVTRPEFQAAGGAVGGYNRFWLDPGNHVMRVNGEPRSSLYTTPNGRPLARKADAPRPAGFPRRSAESALDYESRSQGDRCIIGFGRNGGPPMLPNGFYNNNYLIVQSPEAVMIGIEMNHDTRVIRLNAKHRTDGQRPYFGDAIGWWEGNTLVAETTNIPQSQAFSGSWEKLKVTERFTRVGEHRLHYAFTVEDPDMWDSAWGGEYEFSPLDGIIYEYACHEGNYALPGILAGNLFDLLEAEKKAASAKK